MPVVLAQHPFNERYLDVPGATYNFPEPYWDKIEPYERFLYYRPRKGASVREASSYIGHGFIGEIYGTPRRPDLRTAEIAAVQWFRHPVGYRDPAGGMYESMLSAPAQMQGRAVRRIGETDFHRILAAAEVSSRELSALIPSAVAAESARSSALTSPLRRITEVPAGTGYVPSGAPHPDVVEIAALQERAREDHQNVLQAIIDRVGSSGQFHLNNNIDLLVSLGSDRLLIEAKSLPDPRAAIDRMRYGIGQLADYAYRYRAEIPEAISVLALGGDPGADRGFVGEVLQSKTVAMIYRDGDGLRPGNDLAERLRLF